jgi:hypothetical protein
VEVRLRFHAVAVMKWIGRSLVERAAADFHSACVDIVLSG